MEFSRPEYWSGWPFFSPGNLHNPGIEPRSPALQADSLRSDPQGKPVDRVGGSKWNGNPLALPEEAESQFEKEKDVVHLVPQGKDLIPRVGARGRKQTVPGEDGSCPQHEGREQVDVDVVASAAQPPGGFGRQSGGLSLATQSPLNHVPALPTEPPLDTYCRWSLTTPIFLGKLKPSLCCFCSGLGGPT